MLDEKIGVGHAAADIVVLVPAHEEEVGRRQNGDPDPGIGEPPGEGREILRRHRRQLCHMADDDPPAAAILLGQLADEVNIHVLGRIADIEMNVDVDIEFASELEDPPDLAGMIGVIARRAADRLGAALQCRDQQLVGAGIIGQPVLRENADLDVDRPAVIGDQRLHGFEAAHSVAGIDLDLGAHARRPVEDALGQGALGAGAHILHREARLQRRDLSHRVDQAGRLGRRPIEDPRLVEMDVRLDQPGTGEAPAGGIGFGFAGKALLDRDDLAASHADVDRPCRRIIGEPGILHDQIHSQTPCNSAIGSYALH